MAVSNSQVWQAYKAGLVKRYHTMPSGQQSVADHSFGMLVLTILLHDNPSADLLRAIVQHDMGEWFTGDIPYPFKARKDINHTLEIEEAIGRGLLGFNECELTPDEANWLECIDKIEALMYARLQVVAGNKLFRDVERNVAHWLKGRNAAEMLPAVLYGLARYILYYEREDK